MSAEIPVSILTNLTFDAFLKSGLSYETINAPTLEESNEILAGMASQLGDEFLQVWDKFVVHGTLRTDKATQETYLVNAPDTDGRIALNLLKTAGFTINKKTLECVDPGDWREGAINIDTGYRDGVEVDRDTIFFDHHGDQSGDDTSATQIVYETLLALGLLERSPGLDRLVNFVTELDNLSYKIDLESFRDSWKTVYGLAKYISFDRLCRYFDDPDNPEPGEVLDEDNDIAESIIRVDLGVKQERIEKEKGLITKSLARLKAMETAGLIIPSSGYGDIVVDIGNTVAKGPVAAFAIGAGIYLCWGPGDGFGISGRNDLKHTFPQGRVIRRKMVVREKDQPRTMILKEVLDTLTDGHLEPTKELKDFLEAETAQNSSENW